MDYFDPKPMLEENSLASGVAVSSHVGWECDKRAVVRLAAPGGIGEEVAIDHLARLLLEPDPEPTAPVCQDVDVLRVSFDGITPRGLL